MQPKLLKNNPELVIEPNRQFKSDVFCLLNSAALMPTTPMTSKFTKCCFKLLQFITCILFILCTLPKIAYFTQSSLSFSTPEAFFKDDKTGTWCMKIAGIFTGLVQTLQLFLAVQLFLKQKCGQRKYRGFAQCSWPTAVKSQILLS